MQQDNDPDSRYQKRIGGGMIAVAWLALLGLLVPFFSEILDRQYNPNQRVESVVSGEGVSEVVLKRNQYGHYVADGRINGEPVVFLLDTGATDVALSKMLADRLGLKRGPPSSSQTANGVVTSWMARLDNVSLGEITLHNVRASILPDMGFDGQEVLLGMSFLKQLEMVQRGDTLRLRRLERNWEEETYGAAR
ncbi:TIGR02281 family clan AA aspartic protease [Pseudomonadota bacterium]